MSIQRVSQNDSCNWGLLQDEILLQVFSLLKYPDLLKGASQCCRNWNRVASDERLVRWFFDYTQDPNRYHPVLKSIIKISKVCYKSLPPPIKFLVDAYDGEITAFAQFLTDVDSNPFNIIGFIVSRILFRDLYNSRESYYAAGSLVWKTKHDCYKIKLIYEGEDEERTSLEFEEKVNKLADLLNKLDINQREGLRRLLQTSHFYFQNQIQCMKSWQMPAFASLEEQLAGSDG